MSQHDAHVPGSHESPAIHSGMEDRFRLLVQSVVDYAIYMLDPVGRITSWNPGAEHIKGYTAEEVLGKNFAIFYTEEDQTQGVPARNLSIAARAGRYSEEAWRVRRDGSRFRALIAIDPIRGERGELLGFAKVTRDITERWLALHKLEESELRFRLFAERVPDYALCMVDARRLICHWNEGARRISAFQGEEVLGKPFDELFPPAERSVVMGGLDEAGVAGICETDATCLRKHGAPFQAQVSMRALLDEEGASHGFACVIKDVSAQRTIEAELDATQERLFQSRKMDALGRLTGGIAHDFNNIMQAAMGQLEMARLRLGREEPALADGHILQALESLQRAGSFNQRLLVFARRQPLAPSCMEVNAFVGRLTNAIERTLGGMSKLVISLHEQPLHVECDAEQLEMALLCLVANGRDAMPDGGRLSIAVQPGSLEDGHAAAACVVVEDNGIGIPAELLAHVFDPFFSASRAKDAAGLGLPIVHGFVMRSHGTVRLLPAAEGGTLAEICLPLRVPPADR